MRELRGVSVGLGHFGLGELVRVDRWMEFEVGILFHFKISLSDG